ncbi:MAG: 4Fe-4S dicluster domain-containing protein [Nitrososphaerota archaeon]|nr:4Fe-4S dicluster domain-containing protein [Nitrososphaerales archaeon]MDW8045306.1 4Fe-4S dicluster domain-containing protein [Nitrososphaerota archaeon]
MTRLAHLWDQSRCIGCGSCIAACNTANYNSSTDENKTWKWVQSNIKSVVLLNPRPMLYLVQCQQCDKPSCVFVCPTGASYRDKDGLVKIKDSLCIGCKYCMVACPYEARWLDPKTGLPTKCLEDECLKRVKAGELPVCVEVCPAEARAFGDIDDPSSEISQRLARSRYIRLLENKGTEPKQFIVVGL